jgi:hypothetical protein
MLDAAAAGVPLLFITVTSTADAIRAAVQYAFVSAADCFTLWTSGCPDAGAAARALAGANFVTTPADPPDAGVMLPARYTEATTAVAVNAVSPTTLRRDLSNGFSNIRLAPPFDPLPVDMVAAVLRTHTPIRDAFQPIRVAVELTTRIEAGRTSAY